MNRARRGLWQRPASLLGMAAALALQAAPTFAMASRSAIVVDAGDGRVSPFYNWTAPLSGAPGRILRSEAMPANLGLANAGRQYRFLYVSTDGVSGKGAVPVSASLFLPKGTPPKGGWPLVAWAHGTVGTADICAPSWGGRSYRDVKYLNEWLAQGYAVVSTDYQGLGTPGPHPYLQTRPEAYSVLDSIRAAQKFGPEIGRKAVIVGQSQGAGAAFSAAGYWRQYAPDLKIAGTVVTGIPYFEARQPTNTMPDQVDPQIVVTFYMVRDFRRTHPDIDPATLYQDRALHMYDRAETICLTNLEEDARLEGLTARNSVKPALMTVLSNPEVIGKLLYPTYHLGMPLFVGSGDSDEYTAPTVQAALVKRVCEAKTVVEAVRYPGLTHDETVNASLKDSEPFVRAAFAGNPIHSTCE